MVIVVTRAVRRIGKAIAELDGVAPWCQQPTIRLSLWAAVAGLVEPSGSIDGFNKLRFPAPVPVPVGQVPALHRHDDTSSTGHQQSGKAAFV